MPLLWALATTSQASSPHASTAHFGSFLHITPEPLMPLPDNMPGKYARAATGPDLHVDELKCIVHAEHGGHCVVGARVEDDVTCMQAECRSHMAVHHGQSMTTGRHTGGRRFLEEWGSWPPFATEASCSMHTGSGLAIKQTAAGRVRPLTAPLQQKPTVACTLTHHSAHHWA